MYDSPKIVIQELSGRLNLVCSIASPSTSTCISAVRSTSCVESHLELVQVLYFADEVILQIKDLQSGTQATNLLDLFDVLLVQSYLLKS